MRHPQPPLPMHRTNDLPPMWDGKAVVWDGWEYPTPVFICPPPNPSCCPACGSFATRIHNRGRVAVSAVVTHKRIRDNDAARDRLPFQLKGKLPAVALYELFAFRCPDCGHDQVLDRDYNLWDLEESDYEHEGSVAP